MVDIRLLLLTRQRDAEMGFFSSKKAVNLETYPSNDKSVASVIRSRFYGKNKGKEREPAPSFTTKDAPAAQILSNPAPSPVRAPIRQPSPLSPNSNGARKASPSILRVRTDKMLPIPGSARKPSHEPSKMGTLSSSSSPEVSPGSGLHNQSFNDASSPLRQPGHNFRSKGSVTSGVTSFLRRATSRRTAAGSIDFSDTSSTFSAASIKTNILKRGPNKKSSAASVRTTTSRNQVDNVSISSRMGSQTDHSPHPPVSISRSNASIRRLATPPSSFPSRLPGETYRTSAFHTDIFDDERLQTTTEIRQEISAIEAEVRRLMDAFNGLEMTTLAKLHRHQGPNILADTRVSMSAPTTLRRVLIADSDMTSLKSATSASSMAKSARGNYASPNSARSGSLRRINSSSSVNAEERKTGERGPPPVPALSASYGGLGVGSVSSVSLTRSHFTMSAVVGDEPPLPQPRMEGKMEDEMDDIQRRRVEVSERYAVRLEYLRAKLKGAQLREKLARK
ncbi:hypothetical protein C0992_007171 [Termitomyces sp. T32_za158]|nr:hypothetical protein C0992_007171 [Termitomyces sp. T32_za158]